MELDTCKATIAFVSDNFSRKVLGSSVQIGNSSNNEEKVIGQAIQSIRNEHEIQKQKLSNSISVCL